MKLVKLDPEAGEVQWCGTYAVKESLGWGLEGGGRTAVHMVFSERLGKMVEVDFDTKALIAHIEFNKSGSFEVRRCPIKNRPLLTCPGPQSVRVEMSVHRVHVMWQVDKRFEFDVITCPADEGSEGKELCFLHGGDRTEPVWAPAQVQAARLEEASILLYRADDGWRSKNPRVRLQSKLDYKRLIRDYGDLNPVTANRARIKSRAEADILE